MRLPYLSFSGAGLPQGNGYGTLSVGKTAAVHLTGKLGDGEPFTASGGLVANGKSNQIFPLFAQVYKKKGLVVGMITFETSTNGDLDGAVNWFKPVTPGAYTPEKISTSGTLYGSIYAKPASGPVITPSTGSIVFSGGNLIVSSTFAGATLTSANKITFAPTPPVDFKISIKTSNGLFSGFFKDPTSKVTRKFDGAVFQTINPNYGTGVFQGSTEAGSVYLFPPPGL